MFLASTGKGSSTAGNLPCEHKEGKCKLCSTQHYSKNDYLQISTSRSIPSMAQIAYIHDTLMFSWPNHGGQHAYSSSELPNLPCLIRCAWSPKPSKLHPSSYERHSPEYQVYAHISLSCIFGSAYILKYCSFPKSCAAVWDLNFVLKA